MLACLLIGGSHFGTEVQNAFSVNVMQELSKSVNIRKSCNKNVYCHVFVDHSAYAKKTKDEELIITTINF